MTCDEALDRMLEVDPAELEAGLAGIDGGEAEGSEATELVAHILSCDQCGAVARALRSELQELDAGLEALPVGGSSSGHGSADSGDAPEAAVRAANAALAAIRSEGEGGVAPLRSDAGAEEEGRKSTREGWASRTRRAWMPLAAAAALVGLLFVGRNERPLPPSGATVQAEAIAPRVSVVPPADRGAAIMETANPDITIVWLYEREES